MDPDSSTKIYSMSAMHATGQHHIVVIIASLIAFDFTNVAAMKAMIKLQTPLLAETHDSTYHFTL